MQKALIEKTKIARECYALRSKIAAEHADLTEWRAMRQEARDGAASTSQAAVKLKREATRAVEQANSLAPNERKDFVSKLRLKFHPGESTLMQDKATGYVYLFSFMLLSLGCSMGRINEHHVRFLRNSAFRAVAWATRMVQMHLWTAIILCCYCRQKPMDAHSNWGDFQGSPERRPAELSGVTSPSSSFTIGCCSMYMSST